MSRASLVDVSRYQGQTDVSRIKAAGFVGLVARCTIGWSYLDNQYQRNLEQSREHELVIGAYHVLWPANDDPIREADWFLSKANDADFYVLDVELAHGHTKSQVQEQARLWLEHVRARTNKRIIVYTGSWWWNQIAGWENDWPLWEAEYTMSQPRGGIQIGQQPNEARPTFIGWNDWALWQWTSGGDPLGAASESMDYNVFNGTEQEFYNWVQIGPQEPPGGAGGVAEALASIEIAQEALRHSTSVLEDLR